MPAKKNTETSTIAERMANFAIETGEGMTRLDLKRQGFTEEEIDNFSHEAAIIVAERSTRRVA